LPQLRRVKSDITEDKAHLRREIRSRLATLSEGDRVAGSRRAVALLLRQPVWAAAESILFYAPVGNELDIWPALAAALQEGKSVSLPRFDSATGHYAACGVIDPAVDLRDGQYGIREPAQHCTTMSLNQLDFALVPGVAFDLHGRRLGRGKGYYDRLLAEMRGKTCGVAFDEQIVREVPVQPHDSDVNCILTPTRWLGL
jgi:5-formyltetrahydrofolate cyclo-ligase